MGVTFSKWVISALMEVWETGHSIELLEGQQTDTFFKVVMDFL